MEFVCVCMESWWLFEEQGYTYIYLTYFYKIEVFHSYN